MRLNQMSLLPLFVSVCILCWGCQDTGKATDGRNDLVITSKVIVPSYLGNGIQWGGYDLLEAWTGSPTLTDSDWETLFKRIRFMRPPIVRIMVADGWNYMVDGVYQPAKSEPVLFKILDFCQQEGLNVVIGEWGHQGGTSVDTTWLERSARFLQYLLVTKGYTCITTFNMVNEPNGDWSTIHGNYALWRGLMEQFYAKMEEKGLHQRVKLVGPDIAVWTTGLTSWVRHTHADLGSLIGLYDIHTYPRETEVRDGSYLEMIQAYRNAAPADQSMIMGELGFKYGALTELGIQNALRITNDPYASDDSNMFVYDAFYGIDMADAVMQNMLAGFAGVILWNLDDAMYNKGGTSVKLKRWGFWNILGAEKFGNAADENIRPWFYPMSLLSRYFPAGTEVLDVTLPDKKGLRAVYGTKDGASTLAVVNSNTVSYTLNLRMEKGLSLNGLREYTYKAGKEKTFTGPTDADGFAVPARTGMNINLSDDTAYTLNVPAQSFYLFTNMPQ
jgi:hypothetical protein